MRSKWELRVNARPVGPAIGTEYPNETAAEFAPAARWVHFTMSPIVGFTDDRVATKPALQNLLWLAPSMRIPRHRERQFQTIVSAQSTRS